MFNKKKVFSYEKVFFYYDSAVVHCIVDSM